MFVFFSLQGLALVSVSIEVKSWSGRCLVIMEPRAGSGGALRKDSLKDKYSSILGHTCHLVSIFLLWVNALSSVDIVGDIQLVFAYPASLPSALLTPPHPSASPCSGPPYCLLRHCFFSCVTIISVNLAFTYQIFIEPVLYAGQCCRCGGQGMEHNGCRVFSELT